MNRIIVIGSTGSGKSTVAREIARRLELPYIQIDKLFWKPNWVESTDEELFTKIEQAVAGSRWVLDGNYARTNHLTWIKADTIIWIDLPFWLTFFQNLRRSILRSLKKEEIWEGTGNRESFSRLFSKDSILLWLLKTYDENVKRYEERMHDPKYAHVKFYRLRSRTEIAQFLNNQLPPAPGDGGASVATGRGA